MSLSTIRCFWRVAMLALILGAASSAVAQITIVGSFDNGVSGVGAESWTRYRNDSGQAIRLTRHEWGGEYGFGYDRTITEDVANGAEWTDSHRSYWLDWTGEIGEQHVETLGWEYIETWSWEYWWGAWYDTSAWGPDTDTVPWGTSFTQSKSQRRDKYGRERSSLGNVRNDNTLTDQYETQTVYKEATGTQIVGVSFSVGPTTFTYNGGAQGPNANPNPSNASYFTTWSAGGMPTTPGSYWVRFDGNAGAGYSGTSGNIGFTINKADQAGVTSAGGSVTLGSTFTAVGAGGSGTGGYTFQIVAGGTATGGSVTSGGAITATSTGTVLFQCQRGYDGNYNTSSWSPTYTVTFTAIATTFSVNGPFTYDGSAKTVTITPAPGAATFTSGGTKTATNAGTYTATAAANGNYTGSNNALNWTINKANQATVTSGGGSVSVGSSFSAVGAGGSGTGAYLFQIVAGGTAAGGNVTSGGLVTASGPGTVLFQCQRALDNNYNVSAWSTTYSVTFSSLPITSLTAASVTYNGVARTPVITVAPVGATYTWSLSGGTTATTATNAGTYTLNWSGTGSYTGSGSTTFVINPLSITASTISALTYNGSPQTPISASSVTPSGATVTVSAAAQTNAGTYNTATVTGTGNYTGTLTNQPWTINKANPAVATVSPSTATVFYGTSQTFTAGGGSTGSYAWAGTSGATGTGSSKSVTFPSAGTFTVTVQDPGSSNYNASALATATVTVTAPTYSAAAALNCGSAYVGPTQATAQGGSTSSVAALTVNNTGTGTMSITAGSIAGTNATDFTITAINGGAATWPLAIAAGSSATITVRFAPSAASVGARSATLTLTNNSSNSPSAVASLTGTALGGVLTTSPGSLRSLP
jgi:hypothetical protein